MLKYLITPVFLIYSFVTFSQRPAFPPLFPTRASHDSLKRLRQSLRDTTPPSTAAMLNIGIEPVFTFNNCLKFDIAWKPAHHNYAIELSPELYTGQHILDHTQDDISGFGIGL